MAGKAHKIDLGEVMRWMGPILGPERGFYGLAISYGVGISLLTLATPLSVQLLINSIASTALPAPLFTLATVLFLLLLLSGALTLLRGHLMELFRRRFMARLVAEVTVKTINAANPFFQDERRIDLFNRYFELINVQKNIPNLLIGGFAIILQVFVGVAVTSFYHPIFFAFNAVVLFFVAVIWFIWSRGAMRSGIVLSHQKYEAAHWLESVGASNGFYKTPQHRDYAMDRAEAVIADYVKAHREHYHWTLPQAIAFVVLYAAASAGLLALGGWLVIQEQLSIGQLVAAELILSGAFYGISQLANYLDYYYSLVASVEELSLLYAIPEEPVPEHQGLAPRGSTLGFHNVRFRHLGQPVALDLAIPQGCRLVAQGDPGMERCFSNLLKRHTRPDSGIISLGGVDIAALDILLLRRDIIVLDRPNIVEATIAQYLQLANPQAPPEEMLTALRIVGLDDRIAMLPDGLNTNLSFTGWPLSVGKTMQLKLAAAILTRPRILVLSPLYDMVSERRMRAAFAHFAGTGTTVIHFSNRPQDLGGDAWFWAGREEQVITGDRAEFDVLRGAEAR